MGACCMVCGSRCMCIRHTPHLSLIHIQMCIRDRAQLKAWRSCGFPELTMAVNLSAIQFRQPQLPELVSRVLVEFDLPPDSLELELTEGVAVDDPHAAVANMDQLHARGVRMSMDLSLIHI